MAMQKDVLKNLNLKVVAIIGDLCMLAPIQGDRRSAGFDIGQRLAGHRIRRWHTLPR
jgi:hypothetical protein